MIIGNSKPVPSLFGTQYPGAIPCGTKMPTNRDFGLAAVLLNGVCAGTIESSIGNASVTPTPRRNALLGMCFLVMNIVSALPDFIVKYRFCSPPQAASQRAAQRRFSCFGGRRHRVKRLLASVCGSPRLKILRLLVHLERFT